MPHGASHAAPLSLAVIVLAAPLLMAPDSTCCSTCTNTTTLSEICEQCPEDPRCAELDAGVADDASGPDASPGPDPSGLSGADEVGCACASSSAAPTFGWAALAALAFFGRRRRALAKRAPP